MTHVTPETVSTCCFCASQAKQASHESYSSPMPLHRVNGLSIIGKRAAGCFRRYMSIGSNQPLSSSQSTGTQMRHGPYILAGRDKVQLDWTPEVPVHEIDMPTNRKDVSDCMVLLMLRTNFALTSQTLGEFEQGARSAARPLIHAQQISHG